MPAAATSLVARTWAIEDTDALLTRLPAQGGFAWVHHHSGLVGWGEVARLQVSGPDRFVQAQQWWQELTAQAVVRDEVGVPGSGLLAFGSFAFADSDESVLVVPEVVLGRRDGTTFVTAIAAGDRVPAQPDLPAVDPPTAPAVTFSDGTLPGAVWVGIVADAVARIGRGDVDKVVLAHDVVATAEEALDWRWPLTRLAERFPGCWTFAVDGLIGASPEMLVRLERGLVTSRVLAGTIRRTGDDAADAALAGSLARSSKDLEEHEYAVRSVAEALAPHCSSTSLPEAPYVLHLPNVMHLATDVTGVIADGSTSLELAASLHPSAAVCGTPTAAAAALIAEAETMSRGRYAGPVGWMNAAGDGEWALALRCGQVAPDDPARLRLFAGCGIVAGSDPGAELVEANAKFLAMREALGD